MQSHFQFSFPPKLMVQANIRHKMQLEFLRCSLSLPFNHHCRLHGGMRKIQFSLLNMKTSPVPQMEETPIITNSLALEEKTERVMNKINISRRIAPYALS